MTALFVQDEARVRELGTTLAEHAAEQRLAQLRTRLGRWRQVACWAVQTDGWLSQRCRRSAVTGRHTTIEPFRMHMLLLAPTARAYGP